MIEVRGLTKRFGQKVAVDHLTFSVQPGRVTGFLGPNGAGKSTTMRLILGLDRPESGTATIGGRRYADLRQPLRAVGALLEAKAMHTGRSAYHHLLFLAQSQGLPASRVDEVLALVGLTDVARKRVGGYSLGMSQRVGIAAAMLGNPHVLLLDEPVNGLDPEGILWVRNLVKQLAAEGRAVFVSSHLMSEMAVTADHLIVIGRGRLIADCPTQEFIEQSSERSVVVRSPEAGRLGDLITAAGGAVQVLPDNAASSGDGSLWAAGGPAGNRAAGRDGAQAGAAAGTDAPASAAGGNGAQASAAGGDGAQAGAAAGTDAPAGAGRASGESAERRDGPPAGAITVRGLDAPRIGEIAAAAGIVLHELTPRLASLEEAFMELTAGSVEYGAGPGRQAAAQPPPPADGSPRGSAAPVEGSAR